MRPRVIPVLLIDNGRLVKTINFTKKIYIGDPINAIKIFNEKGADEVIVLDITKDKNYKKPNFSLISKLASECFMPFSYGGGVKSESDLLKILALGVEKVSINTYAIENPLFIKKISDKVGSSTIVVSIDVNKNIFGKYNIFSHNGTKKNKKDLAEYILMIQEYGAGEILLNSIHRDGTFSGYDIDLIKTVSQVTNIPLTVCGGASSVDDFIKAIKIGGASAVAAGSLFVFHNNSRAVLINTPGDEILNKLLGY